MIVSSVGETRRTRTTNPAASVLRTCALLSPNIWTLISGVTDDADLSHDLGADWLDRIELIILVEEITGVEIPDHEANRIEVVGDLILYVDERQSGTRSALRVRGSSPTPCDQPCILEWNHMPIRGVG